MSSHESVEQPDEFHQSGVHEHDASPLSQRAGRSAGEAPQRRSQGRTQRRRRRLKIVGAAVLAVVVLLTLGIGFIVHKLEGNVRTVELSSPSAKDDGKAQNILLIGSDTRASAQDCKLGGACDTSESASSRAQDANADVEMLIHLSADRSHAEVVSIPRDTIVSIPSCQDGDEVDPARRDRINSSMQASVDCTVRTVEGLSELTVQHVAVVDFHGVVTLSNALGGVPVCVDKNVYDPFSKLKLKAGTHKVKGVSALEFVRTRHGFGNGGDLGRTGAQHLFLASLIREVRSSSTLTDPLKLYDVADAATKALTVDKPLASASALVSLVHKLDQVPSDKITFVTMPTTPDPRNPNVLVTTPKTQALFQRLSRDESLSSPRHTASSRPGSSSSSGSPSPSPGSSSSAATPEGQPGGINATTTGCAHVSTDQTVAVNGQIMNPTEAYAASPQVPDSAP